MFIGYTSAWDFLLSATLYYRSLFARRALGPNFESNEEHPRWKIHLHQANMDVTDVSMSLLTQLLSKFEEDVKKVIEYWKWPGTPMAFNPPHHCRIEYLKSLWKDDDYLALIDRVVNYGVSNTIYLSLMGE